LKPQTQTITQVG